MTIDEPPILGGTDKGANPVELLLAALGTCQEIMYGAYASVMGVKLDQVKVEVKGYLDLRGLFGMDPSIPSGYSKIQYKTTIKSPADEATLKNLVATVEGHCPVLDTLTRAVEVTGEVVVNGGRVLTVTALGGNLSAAQRRAYETAGKIRFEGMQLRRDIGHRALAPGRK